MAGVELIEGADDAAIADWLHGHLSDALGRHPGSIPITVPGGSTPFPILEKLLDRAFDWARLVIWPGDDRAVPEDHEASNTGRIRAMFERMKAEVVTLTIMEKVPPFALAWLGMGADGHIASLFPNMDPRVDDPAPIRRVTPDPLPPEAPFDRITLTLPSLLDSEHLLFVIRGAEKRKVFEAAMRGEHDLPVARLLAAVRQRVTCFF